MKRLYHFLGSVFFAVILISLTALMVAVGTYFESTTESHQAAAEIVYKSIFFKALLIGFFINIFVSAIRRFPFRIRHIPFLITHLGLLMLIAGTFIKTSFGIQGNLLLIEGSSSSQVQLPETMVISAIERGKSQKMTIPLKKTILGNYKLTQNNFCKLLEFCPHSEEKIFSWISNDNAFFYGHPPFQAIKWKPGDTWPNDNPLALVTDFKKEAIESLLANSLLLNIIDTQTEKKIGQVILKDLLSKNLQIENWNLQASFSNNTLKIHYEGQEKKGDILISLTGPRALFNQHIATPFLGQAPISIDLLSNIPLTLLQDSRRNATIITADKNGRLYLQDFEANKLPSYFAYSNGFDGYTVQAEFLGPDKPYSRKNLENKSKKEFIQQLTKEQSTSVIPILKIFKEACVACNIDFAKALVCFLEEWHKKGGWLYPENIPLSKKSAKIFKSFDWSLLNGPELKSSLWLAHFFKEFDKSLLNGENFLSILKAKKWPLIPALELLKDEEEQLTLFSQQLFAMGSELPWIPFSQEPETIARIFTAFLRFHGIHYSHIPMPHLPLETPFTTLESPLFRESKSLPPLPKLESNVPMVQLKLNSGEKLSLSFDRFKSDLKWPSLDGRFLLQFHPQIVELPYEVRLHRAKQINYPESEQVFSYESELTFKDRRSKKEIRKTISMNEVHETWDGYRFYLSGLSTTASGAHMVQLVVNRDPAKYWLTYPGGILVALGVALLFWWRKK